MEISRQDESKIIRKDFSEYGQILAVEFSPYVLTQDVMLIAFESRILLGHFTNVSDVTILAEFQHDFRCTALSLSPETSISVLPNIVIFAAGSNDSKLRIFKSNLRGDDSCKILNGHSRYINDVKFDPDNNFLVSTGDDCTAKLWEIGGFKCVATFQLNSPGVSVCWHREDNSKLLVAEKIGLIRFYNVETQSPILSLDYGKPLSSAHWAPSNSQLVASLHLGELLIWDLSKPCVPVSSSIVFTDAGGSVKFSPFGELVAAVNGLEGTMKLLQVQNNHLKSVTSVMLPTNVSWHCRYPILCVGDYMSLVFWKVKHV